MEMERRVTQLKGRRLILDLPENFENHQIEITVLTINDKPGHPRRPHPSIAGKMRIYGDVFNSVPESDWDLQ